jgi:hypothetical protein
MTRAHVRVAYKNADDLYDKVRAIRKDGGAAQTETRVVVRAASYAQA